jgi:4-oxalocrotonate tautomerase
MLYRKELFMPYINLKVAGTLTKEQKSEIVKQFSETLEKVAKKPRQHTYIVIDEVDRKNWAVGDEFLG